MNKNWWKKAVVYQIYPRSFADSNGDGIGDLKGITGKLEYLSELGIDVIWLSPVYQSPNADNGYDISDYQAIMTEFGTMDDFDEMLDKAHSLGLKIMMDVVVNHTSDEHAWFLESRKSRENPYRDYYIWRDPKEDGGPPNRWESSFSGSAWTYDEATGQYYLHLFAEKQPDLNWENEKVRQEVYDMMTWWCEKGVDGFRFDVITLISKQADLPDGRELGNGFTAQTCANGPRVHEYLQEMNEKVLSHYPLITVGESPMVDADMARLYCGEDRGELNMIFHFDHVSGSQIHPGKYGKWDAPAMDLPELKQVLARWQEGLSRDGWNSLYLSNHDQPRCVSRFGDDSAAYRQVSAKMLATAMHMLKGTPYIYQGEELGMTNPGFEEISQYRDVETLNIYERLTREEGLPAEKVMGWIKEVSRDNARTPMQWNSERNAGFTTGSPWIAVNPNYVEINAEKEIEDENSVFHYYQKLIRLRHKMDVIVDGKFDLLLQEDKNLFAYTRTLGDEKLTVLC
ncbi:MAG: alpha-glucosidase, partial [Eubacterium sp.]|nr:alpha-glucosidase [Eubacterium sp.]